MSATTLPSTGHRQNDMHGGPVEQHMPLMDERQLWAINQVHAIEALWVNAKDNVERTVMEAQAEAEHSRQMRELRNQRDAKHTECAQAQHQLYQARDQIQRLELAYDTSQGTIEGMKKDAATAQTQQQALRETLGQQTTNHGIQLVKLVRLRIRQQKVLQEHRTKHSEVRTELEQVGTEHATYREHQTESLQDITRLEQIVIAGREVEANLNGCRDDLVRMTEDHDRVVAEWDQSRSEATSLISCLNTAKESAEALKQTNEEQASQHAEARSRVKGQSNAYQLDAQILLRRVDKYDRSDARAREDYLNLQEAATRLSEARTRAQRHDSIQPAPTPIVETRAASLASTAPRDSTNEQLQPLGQSGTPGTSSLEKEETPAPSNGINPTEPPTTPASVASAVESGIVTPNTSSSSSIPGTPALPKVPGQSRGQTVIDYSDLETPADVSASMIYNLDPKPRSVPSGKRPFDFSAMDPRAYKQQRLK